MAKVYALYKGEENITDGTIYEIAAKTGKKLSYIRWMTYPCAHKKIIRGKRSKGCLQLVYIGEE